MVTLGLWTVECFSYTAKENTHKHWEKIQTSRRTLQSKNLVVVRWQCSHPCPTHSNFLFFISQGLSLLASSQLPKHTWVHTVMILPRVQSTDTKDVHRVAGNSANSCNCVLFVFKICCALLWPDAVFCLFLLQLWGIIKQGYKCKGIISLASSVKVFQENKNE